MFLTDEKIMSYILISVDLSVFERVSFWGGVGERMFKSCQD